MSKKEIGMPKNKKNKEEANPSDPVSIKPIPDDDIRTSRVYANYLEVSHSPFDITLTFCDIPAITENSDKMIVKKKEVRVPVVAKIVVPAEIIKSIIEALSVQHNAYQKTKNFADRLAEEKK